MISLNSLHAEVHDATRAMPGSHDRIQQAIESWHGLPPGLDLCLVSVVSQGNCGELVSLARFVVERGLAGIMFQVLAPVEAHYSFADHPEMPSDHGRPVQMTATDCAASQSLPGPL